ncbi:hypothetical protein Btru_059845 [Bulinus truncatus]|nr:hypothetical protein Btru_059845 [Bulinus truncatus]
MLYTSFVITVGIVLSFVQAEETISDQFFTVSPTNKVKLGEKLEFNCTFHVTVQDIFKSTLEIYRKAGDKKVILTELARLQDDAPPEFYHVQSSPNFDKNLITLQFSILKVRDIDDGKLYCSLTINSVPLEYSVDIVVLRPLTDLKLILDNHNPINTNQNSQIEVQSGSHQVQCIAEGSNPEAKSVELYLHGLKQEDSKKVSSELMGGELTKYRTILKAKVNIASSHTGQDLECKATSQYGDSKSVKVPLKVVIEEPDAYCNDTEAYVGQRDTRIICRVDHRNSRLKTFKFEVGDKVFQVEDNRDQMHYVDTNELPTQDGRRVTEVTLTLQQAEASHFEDENIYLLAEHDDGHITRLPIKLINLEGGNESDGHNGRDGGNASNVIKVSHAMLWLSLIFFFFLLIKLHWYILKVHQASKFLLNPFCIFTYF